MSFLTTLVMIRGDHRAALPTVFEQFDYRVKSGPTPVKDWVRSWKPWRTPSGRAPPEMATGPRPKPLAS